MSIDTTSVPPPRHSHETHRDEPLWEIVEGERVELPEMGGLSNLVKSDLHLLLGSLIQDAALGCCTVETVFILDEQARQQRRPDLAFVSYERWPADQPVEWEGELKVVPDLCIEITSPTDLHAAVLHKVREYLEFGVREVWVVTPTEKTIAIHRSRTDVSLFTDSDVLTTPDLLPGVEIPLAKVFARVTSLK